MKVKELIELLSKLDQDENIGVSYEAFDECCTDEIMNVFYNEGSYYMYGNDRYNDWSGVTIDESAINKTNYLEE